MANVSSSNSQGVRVPKLRFPGFEGEWESSLLGEVGTFTKGAPLSKADISEEGTPFILYGELYTTYNEVTNAIVRKTDKAADSSQYSRIGDVIIPTSGETPEEIATATCVMLPNVILAGDLNIFRSTKVDGRIISYIINHIINQDISRIAQGKSVVHIKAGELSKIRINYPNSVEQKKLILFLEILSARIEKQQQLVELLKSYKRGVIQYIFHSSSKEGWSCLQLGRVFKKVTHRNTDGSIKNVITNSAEYGLIPQRDFFDKDIAVEGNTLNYFVIEPGAFVYNPRKSTAAPYGPFNRYTLRESGIISPLYTCLVLEADIDPSYLAWYFKSDAWHRFIYDNGSQGVRHDRVSMTDDLLMSIPVAVPPADKQRQITQILDSVETLLLTAQKEYALLEKLYKGFLRQLFI